MRTIEVKPIETLLPNGRRTDREVFRWASNATTEKRPNATLHPLLLTRGVFSENLLGIGEGVFGSGALQ